MMNESFDARISRLELLVQGLNLGGCKYGKDSVRRLESNLASLKSNNKRTKPVIDQYEDFREYWDSIDDEGKSELVDNLACDDSCIGDAMGQCDIGCDGKRTLSVPVNMKPGDVLVTKDGEFSYEQLTTGRPLDEIISIDVGEAVSPVDNVPSQDIEDREWELLAVDMELSPESMSIIRERYRERYGVSPTVHNIERLSKKEVCELLTTAPASNKSKQPRREAVEKDGCKVASSGDSGSEGLTEGRDSEQNANIERMMRNMLHKSMECYAKLGYVVIAGKAYEWAGGGWKLIEQSEPIAKVYCMGGHCYE